jgi:hypothetical protein
MKYLVNKVTKEHRVLPTDVGWSPELWSVVQADSEGWIKYKGNECPLPKHVKCDIKVGAVIGSPFAKQAHNWAWDSRSITHYRPIIEQVEKVQEPEPVVKDSLTTDILDRLKAAHEAAQQIPDLESDLRDVLGGMGYDVVRCSPFAQQRHGAQGE